MVESLLGALISILTFMAGKLPQSPVNFETYIATFRTYMAYINWFVPFYRFAAICNVYLALLVGTFAVWFIIRFVVHKVGG